MVVSSDCTQLKGLQRCDVMDVAHAGHLIDTLLANKITPGASRAHHSIFKHPAVYHSLFERYKFSIILKLTWYKN